jgi:uncharacterized protein (DUF433 family)
MGKDLFNRLYSFRDVVGLTTIGLLRSKYHVAPAGLRCISEELRNISDADWSDINFYISGDGHVYFTQPGEGSIEATHPAGERPLFKMRDVIRNVEKKLAEMNRRKPAQFGKIDQNRHVAGNATVVAGTRIPTAAIFQLHQAGYSIKQIIREFPRLTPADVEAAIKHEELRVAG